MTMPGTCQKSNGRFFYPCNNALSPATRLLLRKAAATDHNRTLTERKPCKASQFGALPPLTSPHGTSRFAHLETPFP